MVHIWLKFLKAKEDHLLPQNFLLNFFFGTFLGKKPPTPCSCLVFFVLFWCFLGGGKCAPFIDPIKGKCGPLIGPTAYIYICAVGSITWPHFGHFKVNNLATVRSITWPPFFEPIKIVFF